MEKFIKKPESIPSEQDKEVGPKLLSPRASLLEYLKRLQLPVLAFALVGCASPIGSVVEKAETTNQNTHQSTQKQETVQTHLSDQAEKPDTTPDTTFGSFIDKLMYPNVDWGFTPAEEQEIRSSPLANAIRELKTTFTPKQLNDVLDQLPLLYERTVTPSGEKLTPTFNARFIQALAQEHPMLHIEMPSDDDLAREGVSKELLMRSIFENAGSEWNIRYGRVPVPSEKKEGVLTCRFIAASSIHDFNTQTQTNIHAVATRHSPLIGEYTDLLDQEFTLPAISPAHLFQEASVPNNVLEEQYRLEQGKNFQKLFLDGVTNNKQNKDKFDIMYGAVQTFSVPFSDKLRGKPDIMSVHGDDGKDYGIIPRNTQIAFDKSNLLIRALMELSLKKNFEEKDQSEAPNT